MVTQVTEDDFAAESFRVFEHNGHVVIQLSNGNTKENFHLKKGIAKEFSNNLSDYVEMKENG